MKKISSRNLGIGIAAAIVLGVAAGAGCSVLSQRVSTTDQQAIRRVLDGYARLAAEACLRQVSDGELRAAGIADGASGADDYVNGMTKVCGGGPRVVGSRPYLHIAEMRRDDGRVTARADIGADLSEADGQTSSYSDLHLIDLVHRDGHWLIIGDRIEEPGAVEDGGGPRPPLPPSSDDQPPARPGST